MKQESRYLINPESHRSEQTQILNKFILEDIDTRLNDLEYGANKKSNRPQVTRAEKSAILFELGVMDYLLSLPISQRSIAQLLEVVMDECAENIKKDLSTRHQENCTFKHQKVYEATVKRFSELKLSVQEEAAQKTLDKVFEK